MKKMSILLCCICLTNIFWANPPHGLAEEVVTELIMTCQFSSISESIAGSGPCSDAAITVQLGDGCNGEVVMEIFVANLSPNVPIYGSGPYELPVEMPDIYVEYDSDLDQVYDTVVGPINDFYFKGITAAPIGNSSNGVHYVYQHELLLFTYNAKTNLCKTGSASGTPPTLFSINTMPVRLVCLSTNGYETYRLGDHAGPNDVFSCEIFHETCGFCTLDTPPNCSISTPTYAPEICFDCKGSCDAGTRTTEEEEVVASITEKQSILQKISPNPFQEEVTVSYSTPNEELVWIEVLDLNGKIIQEHQLPASIGEQTHTLDLSNVAAGIYYCRLQTTDTVEMMKIVKSY